MVGYSLRNYDPCFNFNNDNFCCSQGNRQLYTNLALNEARARATVERTGHSYNVPRNANPADLAVPLNLRQLGLVQDAPYTFTALGAWPVPCSRMPCGIYSTNKFPCQRK